MKKQRSSLSLLSALGIGAIFGVVFALSDLLATIIPFKREWVTYALLFTLSIMAIKITFLWRHSAQLSNSNENTDEKALMNEKLAYKFTGFTSLFLIIGSGALFIVLLEWIDSVNLLSGSMIYSLMATSLLFFYGVFAQIKAIKFHNKFNPNAFLNWKSTDGYQAYFENLDEGEKFEQYRVAYKSFYSMNIVFPAVLILLLLISQIASPQFIAIGIVAALWLIMYVIYYREGYKIYK